jgi:Spy/CpxP family protein refolding chaperone
MTAGAAGRLVASAAVSANEAPAQQAQASRGGTRGNFQWWNDPEVQRELALSADKIKRINDLYARRNQEVQALLREYQKEFAELDRMTRERVVDESTYLLQVMRFEFVRARLNESRTVMLYRFFRELTPEQHQKLQAILDRGRGGGPGRSTSPGR